MEKLLKTPQVALLRNWWSMKRETEEKRSLEHTHYSDKPRTQNDYLDAFEKRQDLTP